MSTAVIFQLQSILVFSLLTIGIIFRKNRSRHVKIMSTAIIWDILLILQIELTRSAIGKASGMLKNPVILNIHVLLAVSSVILYLFMIYTGRNILKNEISFKSLHKLLGWTTYVVRFLTLVTSYWAVAPKNEVVAFLFQ